MMEFNGEKLRPESEDWAGKGMQSSIKIHHQWQTNDLNKFGQDEEAKKNQWAHNGIKRSFH